MEGQSNSIVQKLRNGEKVLCSHCKKGFYWPYNSKPEKAHCFMCDNCKSAINIDEKIDIE